MFIPRLFANRLPGWLLVLLVMASVAQAEEAADAPAALDAHAAIDMHRGPACYTVDPYFATEVWSKVAEVTCLNCHVAGGDAAESQFLLQKLPAMPDQRQALLYQNQRAFQRMAAVLIDQQPRLLLKAQGGLDHGGGEVLKPDSTGLKILTHFVRRSDDGAVAAATAAVDQADARPFFEGVEMLPDTRLLRRVALSLAGRLPTDEERAAVAAGGMPALLGVMDRLMQEEAFYDRLKEAFNDIFLTRGLDDSAEGVLSYQYFHNTRLWPQKYDFSDLPEKDRKQAGYKLYREYREAMHREPMELIAYIVRNDRPFTEVVTADYLMMSPYTARGYGRYEELKDQFQDPEDPYEFIPTRLPQLTDDRGKSPESPTGFFPHSGLLTAFHYPHRYPNTETNRNRLRARMYFQHFLGIDLMQLAPRTTDAAAADAKYEIPTMQAAECVVCHRVMDPIAGLFQDYALNGDFQPRKEPWYEDMFGPGRDGEDLPAEEKWRAMQWLGERTARDPRFAVAMVEHVYYLLCGRQVLQSPQDIDDPLFAAKRRAYLEQRGTIEKIAQDFAANDFNLKYVIKAMVATPFYRADGLATGELQPERLAEIEDVGLVRLLTPEQLERKIAAVFGQPWGKLQGGDSKMDILYGGIDFKEITERIADPSGAMGAIQRIMANEVSCKNVAFDFTTPPSQRLLFPHMEPNVTPDDGPAAERQIREAIVHLHQRLLGRDRAIDDPEVERTWLLFTGILADAKAAPGFEKVDSYFCRGRDDKRLDDPHYTLRAWRAVVTYLLRQHEFLYE
ncbi:hypothetical protein [Lignipirellula cremea]|uniref:DUF1592 domain-containing protein n=1 Tax=Lignipirellula cremea TaxID=2528010 RepID=A0A518E0Y8_9BACT|nr:hypothetical protein [Lignipirellula cremea]QDU97759.1 hypothetical protein Pla8534_56150 [Lignipirellula cremea]